MNKLVPIFTIEFNMRVKYEINILDAPVCGVGEQRTVANRVRTWNKREWLEK
jgi:hypothetical protein